MTRGEAEAAAAALSADEQCVNLSEQLTVLASEYASRAHDAFGIALSAGDFVFCIFRGLSKASDRKVAVAVAGPVVGLGAVRAAKAPASVNRITVAPAAETSAAIDAVACRDYGEANAATRSLVVQTAISRGLQLLEAGA